MVDIMDTCLTMYDKYFGEGIYLPLLIGSLVYIVVCEKNKEKISYIKRFVFLFFLIFWCPITSSIIINYCIDEDVYWRMFWILPITVIIGYVIVDLITNISNKSKKIFVVLLLLLLVMERGDIIYNESNFSKTDNFFKINPDVITICEVIKNDAKERGIEQRSVIVTDELLVEVKQYDGSIRMPYGRGGQSNYAYNIDVHDTVNSTELHANHLAFLARQGEYDYFVYYRDVFQERILNEGYVKVESVGAFDIYYYDVDYK